MTLAFEGTKHQYRKLKRCRLLLKQQSLFMVSESFVYAWLLPSFKMAIANANWMRGMNKDFELLFAYT
jgi:hypothetical protein